MVRLADYVINTLYKNYVKHIFMVTGRGALFLTDAVAAHKEIDGISVHHEQSAAYAAVSYAQFNGKLGACLVSTGCAGTNAITGVLNAWQDGIPCVFISGQNKLNETTHYTGLELRTFGQQEADIIPMVKSITKYSVMITDPKKIVYELEKAIYLAQSGRKGPVWIDIPLDVQNMRVDIDNLEHYIPEEEPSKKVSDHDMTYLVNLLNSSQRPVVLIGSGVNSSYATEELERFIENNNIPLVYAPSAADIYGLENDLSIGSVGIMGCSRAGNFSIQNSDLLLVLGNRLNSMVVGEKCQFARESKVVVVDIDEVEHSKGSVNIDRLIISDIKNFLICLNNEKIEKINNKWVDKCLHWKKIFPKCEDSHRNSEKVDLYHLSETLSKVLPEKSSLVTDSGLIELILPSNMSFGKKQRSIHPKSQGSMGAALPAIIGVHYSSNNPVICVVGDGSIMMNLQELITISYKKIPAKIFVINNNAYAVIRKRMKEMFRNRTIGTDSSDGVGAPEFEKVANTFNFSYVKIDSSKNLEKSLQSVINMEGPVLCEIMALEDQDYIASGHARDSKKRIVARPIEDQKPFLNRELFLKEMIINPIHQ
ncbi:MAG: thiamine pyrophosphate-binding protein [Arcobacter sp.]|nr:MAG: thiamine pyrophosphate-binding protein [Arcobacter sp.]